MLLVLERQRQSVPPASAGSPARPSGSAVPRLRRSASQSAASCAPSASPACPSRSPSVSGSQDHAPSSRKHPAQHQSQLPGYPSFGPGRCLPLSSLSARQQDALASGGRPGPLPLSPWVASVCSVGTEPAEVAVAKAEDRWWFQLAVLAGDRQRGGGQLGRDGVPGVLKPVVRWISAVLPQMAEICEVVSPGSVQPGFCRGSKRPGRTRRSRPR